MSFPKYEAYKDSGVEWLGEVPEHWEVLKLKRIASFQSGTFITGDSIEPKGIYPVFGGNGLRGYTNSYTHKGDFALIGRQGALCGNINYGTGQFWASEHAVVVSPHDEVITKWIGELLRSMNLNQYSVSAAQPGLAVERIIDLYIPYPDTSEQAQIARFLDHETARIDALIAEQQRLIELLKEKRQAVISHAVTKGLDAIAPMKDSGVEWLGEVPAHWEVSRLKYHSSKTGDGLHSTPEYDEAGDYFFINGNNLVEGRIRIASTTRTVNKDEFLKHQVPLGNSSILLSINGTIGNLAIYDNEKIILGKSAAYINLKNSILREYCLYLFRSNAISNFFYNELTGTTIFNLSLRSIAETPVTLPPVGEQRMIVCTLDKKVGMFDESVSEAKKTVSLLQERRSALISAAVTGKIDVRGWQAPASAAPAPTLEPAHG